MTYGPVARITTQLHPRQKNVPAPAGTGGKLKAELEHGSSTALERFLMLGAQIVVQKSISALIKKKNPSRQMFTRGLLHCFVQFQIGSSPDLFCQKKKLAYKEHAQSQISRATCPIADLQYVRVDVPVPNQPTKVASVLICLVSA